ncbi:hypothetical protein MOB49_12050 [Bacillus haynesii]|jgi:hypothetical protein|uniref:hypothetical protein n=1 Tax=Bacillus TaxID=1386 RepID=UPI00092B7E51|nr:MULTISPECIES: hypothetical protein [Bacillus]MCY7967824.1 hypothetical protein [Bacillus haynesii]MCY8102322.1 hypothetical protein [Bacillus haynesii]MCY8664981.1 hypothetical protein [Bacillus haynesii]MEC1050938.1 hypothetical protein [Bacillus paralicheniformis]MEC1085030.1 hypothetical protein [Bacillus paralicheniformis]
MEIDKKSVSYRRQKKLFFLIAGIFFGCLSLYLYSLFGESDTPKSGSDKEVSQVDMESPIKEEKIITDDKDKAEMQRVLSQFVRTYYSFDKKNPQKHLEDSKKFLTAEFYKELSMSEDSNATVPPFAYRAVKDISYSDYQTVNGTPHWTLAVNADLQDEKKRTYSSIEVEFVIDLDKRKGDWRVAYFAVTGKGINENE